MTDFYQSRNAAIYRQWLSGSPLRDIAVRWMLEVSTVRNIIEREKQARKADCNSARVVVK